MKQKRIKIANGLNKLVYDRDEDPVDGVKLSFEQLVCNTITSVKACIHVNQCVSRP